MNQKTRQYYKQKDANVKLNVFYYMSFKSIDFMSAFNKYTLETRYVLGSSILLNPFENDLKSF